MKMFFVLNAQNLDCDCGQSRLTAKHFMERPRPQKASQCKIDAFIASCKNCENLFDTIMVPDLTCEDALLANG